MRIWRFAAVVVMIATLGSAASASAKEAEISRLNWLMWWESARDIYFKKLTTKGPASRPAMPGEMQQRAIETLLRVAKDKDVDPELRKDAILALGRARDPKVLPELKPLLSEIEVALTVPVAAGLIGDETATAFLLEDPRKERLAEATIVGLALVDKPSEAVLQAILTAAANADLNRAHMVTTTAPSGGRMSFDAVPE